MLGPSCATQPSLSASAGFRPECCIHDAIFPLTCLGWPRQRAFTLATAEHTVRDGSRRAQAVMGVRYALFFCREDETAGFFHLTPPGMVHGSRQRDKEVMCRTDGNEYAMRMGADEQTPHRMESILCKTSRSIGKALEQ